MLIVQGVKTPDTLIDAVRDELEMVKHFAMAFELLARFDEVGAKNEVLSFLQKWFVL